MKQLLKVDKNGTKYWFDDTCPKCGGSGYISGYRMIEGGVCFKGGGNGAAYGRRSDDRNYCYDL